MSERTVILFGGKGGVGKTTCSAAVAAASAASGKRTLILTSDMTPSLGDIFCCAVGETITAVDEGLFAYEIGPDAITNRWKTRFSRDFSDILSQLVDLDGLDAESRHQLLDYIGSAPSLREETMLDLIVDLVESGDYDRVIWDTAPAGETLNLLNMPRFIRKHLTAGARVFEGLDKIGKHLAGRRSIAQTMDEWIGLSERIAQFIGKRTTFVIVAKPEALVVKHVERLVRTLRDYSLEIRGMIVNGMTGEEAADTTPAPLQAIRRGHCARLTELAGPVPTALVPLSSQELRGIPVLRDVGREICRQLRLAQ
jgi:arsenite-transporting ATPase